LYKSYQNFKQFSYPGNQGAFCHNPSLSEILWWLAPWPASLVVRAVLQPVDFAVNAFKQQARFVSLTKG
jgi:hypothetical protein